MKFNGEESSMVTLWLVSYSWILPHNYSLKKLFDNTGWENYSKIQLGKTTRKYSLRKLLDNTAWENYSKIQLKKNYSIIQIEETTRKYNLRRLLENID